MKKKFEKFKLLTDKHKAIHQKLQIQFQCSPESLCLSVSFFGIKGKITRQSNCLIIGFTFIIQLCKLVKLQRKH